MTLVLELPPHVEARLKTNAAVHGKDIVDYLLTLAENDPPIDMTEFEGMAEFQASVAGVGAGLADLDAGRTLSLEQITAELAARAETRRERSVSAQA